MEEDEIIRQLRLENEYYKKEYTKLENSILKLTYVFNQIFPEGKIPTECLPADIDDKFIEGLLILGAEYVKQRTVS